MAAVMTMRCLQTLLAEAASEGCSLAWIQDTGLRLGRRLGEPRYAVDFSGERLAPVAPDEAGAEEASGTDRVHGPEAGRHTPAARFALDLAAGPPGRRTGSFSLTLEGRLIVARSQRALLLVGLQAIERMRPGTLEKLASEKGRTKRVVAKRRELLYANPGLAKYAEQIDGGWWVATNNNFWEVQKFVRRAAFHAGLHVDIRRSP